MGSTGPERSTPARAERLLRAMAHRLSNPWIGPISSSAIFSISRRTHRIGIFCQRAGGRPITAPRTPESVRWRTVARDAFDLSDHCVHLYDEMFAVGLDQYPGT